MEALRGIDHIAYIRFASVYRAFADLDSLKDALQALDEGRDPSSRDTQQLALPGDGDAQAAADAREPAPAVRSVG